MKKKVFSSKKYEEDPDVKPLLKEFSLDTWCKECEGLTKRQIKKLGYEVMDEWMVKVDE